MQDLVKDTHLTAPQDAAAAEDAADLIREVWEVVAENYLDARGGGFDTARCTTSQLCQSHCGNTSAVRATTCYHLSPAVLLRVLHMLLASL